MNQEQLKSSPSLSSPLYPEIEPYAHGTLAVDNLHTLYWEESGNPDGLPLIYLHGGPGVGADAKHRRYFDPDVYRIIIFDQRGCGRSTPKGETQQNTTQHMIQDIEALRMHRGVERWAVFGSSWGSTLALAYGETHPDRCLGFILRGVFLARQADRFWHLHGPKHFFPEKWEKFTHALTYQSMEDISKAYADQIFDTNPEIHLPAAARYLEMEGALLRHIQPPEPTGTQETPDPEFLITLARVQIHYILNHHFLEEDTLLQNIGRIAHLPAVIVQGRYDMVCPPISAHLLSKSFQKAELLMIPDGGHSSSEPSLLAGTVAACDAFKERIP